MKKINFARTKIFDGFETDLFKEDFKLDINGIKINFIADDITPNQLSNLVEVNLIIDDIETIKTDVGILSNDGLPLYYLKTKNLLLLFSMGEFQPARYMLYLENVWQL